MTQIFTTRVGAVLVALLLGLAPAVLAQSTMVRGKVVDGKQQPMPGVTIVVESLDGSGRKLTSKTDRKRRVRNAIAATADQLGNTPPVCRSR